MVILGINGGFGGGYQDACACLYADGRILAAVEEERLVKQKFATGLFPLMAIKEVLQLSGLQFSDIHIIAFHGATWGSQIETDLQLFFRHHFGTCPAIRRFHHHDAHAASSYYVSGFDDALIVSIDNSGDGTSSQVMTGRNGKLELLKRWARPNSFGAFYSAITQLAGFKRDSDEYKLMGLAPYGDPDRYDFSDILRYDGNGDYTLDTSWLYPIPAQQAFPNKQLPLYNPQLAERLGISDPASMDAATRRDLAASAQARLEDVVCEWITYWMQESGMKNLCLSGGVAMNCVMNQRILERCRPEKLFVPPFSSDQGISVGNTFLAGAEAGILPDAKTFTPYTGRSYSQEAIEAILQHNGIRYQTTDDPARTAAQWLHEGRIIGWFQGRAEIGARALGNRSILANPAIPGMKDRINARIKFREGFRPFCPSVLAEDSALYFETAATEIPYMNLTANCTELAAAELPEVVHADRTARVQTVSKENNAIFHRLLLELKKRNGHGAVLNTSLNVRNQPMAYDVNDALTAFFTSGMDALIIENILIEKPA